MKKFLTVLLGAAAIACCAAGLSACKKKSPADQSPANGSYAAVTGADINADGELVLSYSDGTTRNLGKVRGENGADGNDGNNGSNGKGIADAQINADGELVLSYSDGTTQNLGKVKGENGADGNDGVAIPCAHSAYSAWQTKIAASCTSVGVSAHLQYVRSYRL